MTSHINRNLIGPEILSVRSGPEKSLCRAIPPIPIFSVRNIVIVIGVVGPVLHKLQCTDFFTDIGIVIVIVIAMVGPGLKLIVLLIALFEVTHGWSQ